MISQPQEKQDSPSSYTMFSIGSTLSQLLRFYPQSVKLNAIHQLFHQTQQQNITHALTFTAASWFLLFQFARRGKVLPVFREYGAFFKTHRLFRQYLYCAVVPYTLLTLKLYVGLNTHVGQMWRVHMNRHEKGLGANTMDRRNTQKYNYQLPKYKVQSTWYDAENRKAGTLLENQTQEEEAPSSQE